MRRRLSKTNVLHEIDTYIPYPMLYGRTNMKHMHVAIIIKRRKVLAVASNRVGSRTSGCGYDTFSIHAERAAIKSLGDRERLRGAILIVVRIAKGTRGMADSTPCSSCRYHLEKCMEKYGLRGVYYSTD